MRPSSDPNGATPTLSAKTITAGLLSTDLLEALPDAIVAVDRDGTIVQVNSQAQELFGYDREELIGQKVEMLVPDSDRRQHHQHRQSFAQTPKTRRMGADLDLYGRRRDGSEFPVEISLSPVSTETGWFVLSAIRDISDRKRIDEELRRANEELHRRTIEQLGEYRSRLASIIDSSEDAILSKDMLGNITSWNKGAEHIYGYAQAEVVGKHISLLAPSDRSDEIPEILQRIARGEGVEHHESVRITKDGRRLDMSLSVSPLRDAAGEIVGASVIARDITAQKKAEGQLRQAQKMEAIGRLAGGVAHDFNNILAIITSCTEFLRDRIDPAAPPSVYVENIRKATERGTSLTKQMLAFSRTSAIQLQILDLNERLREISKLLRPLLGDDVEILIVPRSPSAIIEADPGQLDQIVVNLAVNARDAMPRGGRLTIETSNIEFDNSYARSPIALAPGRYVMLAVTDNGMGMDAETQAHIFEPFFTTKEKGKGTGLGLATVYGIVKQSGGYIWVYSEPGNGTTFKVYLPAVEEVVSPNELRPAVKNLPRGTETILLVEDEQGVRDLAREYLEICGYSVLVAEDGAAALRLVEGYAGPIDLMMTDVVMPGMNGSDLADRVAGLRPEMRVIYMSGYTDQSIVHHGLLAPEMALLQKPFTLSTLAHKLREALAPPPPRS